MKKIILFNLLLLAVTLNAKTNEQSTQNTNSLPTIKTMSDIKFSGYLMTEYQASFREDAKRNSFSLRLLRLSLEGRLLNDFYWRIQMQANGNTSTLGASPRIVDLFAEWQKYTFFQVKVGQFKRPFTFENPINPITQGFMSYSQAITRLSGFADRVGEHASNGRDIGVQIQGDFLKNSNNRALLHYQIGVFNGQGINTSDTDQQKDLIGGIWIMPIKGMRISTFGWTGTYTRNNVILDKRRYAVSADYSNKGWIARSEYIHSTGAAFRTTYNTKDDLNNTDINTAIGDKADAFYANLIAPIIKNKFEGKIRYDLYRDNGEWSRAKAQYEIGANYYINKFVRISAEYARVNDKTITITNHNYNLIDVQLAVKF